MNVPGATGEEALLAACVRGLRGAGQGSGVVTGIGDDAAVLTLPRGERLLATVDMLVEGQHFVLSGRGAILPEHLGWRMLAVNLSDVAAMGGRPLWALCSLGAPAHFGASQIEQLYSGLGALARAHGVAVVGGNLARVAERLILDVTVLGAAPRPVRRVGAVPGDLICVTGRLGAAAAGLAYMSATAPGAALPPKIVEYVTAAQWRPQPRVSEGQALGALAGVHAMCDVSDGLTRDLVRLCGSGLGAVLWRDALPVPAPVRAAGDALGVNPLWWALAGGEDYELLCAIAPDQVAIAQASVQRAEGCPLHVIGEFRARDGLWLAVSPGGSEEPLTPSGWDPFA